MHIYKLCRADVHNRRRAIKEQIVGFGFGWIFGRKSKRKRKRKNKMKGGSFMVGVAGISLLFHAAYQTIFYRGVLKIREEEFLWPPPQVLLEIAISLALCFWAALRVPGRFLPILPSTEGNRLLHTPENLDFITFNHRGKVFPLKLDSKLKR